MGKTKGTPDVMMSGVPFVISFQSTSSWSCGDVEAGLFDLVLDVTTSVGSEIG